ncbi:Ribbon-helix-helix domain-containing protein [Parasphingorhabdus marina DSM 22363]|uniref:Ribbon-helix-helix domain-containing protein n=1 Tax=Parasphingorhabdus marina DSM 22363 TaxID=1123272 RepID=A0A1N6CYG0_9SPHN|nr:ribbon-helix-helix domain-containing protein [Parasphingorhabdus marina]SIN63552.1 Ribbon-helix-helix domain-containing protein [Parasphingorhabdus marina DSM 22363]
MDLDETRPDIFHPPVKRSVTIAGHQTSITLEPLFWDLLKQAADVRSLPVNALVARIDVARLEADEPPGLATAIRLWLTDDLLGKSDEAD